MSLSEISSLRSTFWHALNPTEREVFRSVASARTFAAGARLMAEGERGDRVMVILTGRVKVCVNENGAECVLAVRGPGQLMGERAALQVSVRSATVTALETVNALEIMTADFTELLSAHPRALELIQDQTYDRLVETSLRTTTTETTPRAPYLTEKTARRLTGLAVAVGGDKRAWRAEEFLADLSRGTTGGDAPTGWAQLRYAIGLILGALRLRARDARKPLLRLLDWSLAKPEPSESSRP